MSCFNNVCAIRHTCCVKFHQSAKNNLQDQVCSVLTALVSNCCTADLCRWHEIFLFLTFITHLISEHLKYFFASYTEQEKEMYQNKIQFEQLLTGISLKCSETACLCWHWPKFYTVMEPLHVHNVSQFPIFTQTACRHIHIHLLK